MQEPVTLQMGKVEKDHQKFDVIDHNGDKFGTVYRYQDSVSFYAAAGNIKVRGSFTQEQAVDIAQRFADLIADVTA